MSDKEKVLFKDRRHQPPPMEWTAFRPFALEKSPSLVYHPGDWPDRFVMSPTIMKHIETLVPKRGILAEIVTQGNITGGRRQLDNENDRILYRDRHGNIRIATHSIGTSVSLAMGIQHYMELFPGVLGFFHSHPIDAHASAKDLVPLVERSLCFIGIVTPRRSFMFFPSTETPDIYQPLAAWGYLQQMGKVKGRSLLGRFDEPLLQQVAQTTSDQSFTDGNWQIRPEDLVELGIVSHEAPRGKTIFVRQT